MKNRIKKIAVVCGTLAFMFSNTMTTMAHYNNRVEKVTEKAQIAFTNENLGWSCEKVYSANAIYRLLSEQNYTDELISGFISNSLHEGFNGQMEGYSDVWYWEGVEDKYIEMAGQKLTDMEQVDTLLELEDWPGIGVGMIQWSGERRQELLELYKEKECDFTFESLAECEAEMMTNEITGKYNTIAQLYKENQEEYDNFEDQLKLATGIVVSQYERYLGYEEDVDPDTYMITDDENVRYQSAIHIYKTIKEQEGTGPLKKKEPVPRIDYWNKNKDMIM